MGQTNRKRMAQLLDEIKPRNQEQSKEGQEKKQRREREDRDKKSLKQDILESDYVVQPTQQRRNSFIYNPQFIVNSNAGRSRAKNQDDEEVNIDEFLP